MENLKYPIGRFSWPTTTSPQKVNEWIAKIEAQPSLYRSLLENISEEDLNLTYRPEGWTIRQVAHHVVDSHINSLIRFKWTLTEDNPTIKAYYEDRWAILPDTQLTPVSVSLNLMEALHQRWVVLLKSLTPEQLSRTFIHPESGRTIRLDELISLYAWHGQHHLEHIKLALANK